MPHLWPTGSSLELPPSTTARYFSACPSDPTSRWAPCPPECCERWLQVHLGCVRLSPSCPLRLLHTFHSLRPARRYPRLWIRRSSSERRRDFNPPDQCAAQRTLRAPPTPGRATPFRRVRSSPRTPRSPVLRTPPFAHMPRPLPRWVTRLGRLLPPGTSAFPAFGTGRHPRSPLGACSGFTRVAACALARPPFGAFFWASAQRVTPLHRPMASEAHRQFLGRDFHPLVTCTFHGAPKFGPNPYAYTASCSAVPERASPTSTCCALPPRDCSWTGCWWMPRARS